MDDKYQYPPKLCVGDLVHIVLDIYSIGIVVGKDKQDRYKVFWSDSKDVSPHYDYILRKFDFY